MGMMKHQLLIGVLLTTLGFVYQVIGAWPVWNQAYPWEWQTEIAKQGFFPVWSLFVLSLVALIIGIILLYIDSTEYHKRHPDL